MKKITVVCEDSFDGIMTGVYKAWEYNKEFEVYLNAGELSQFELFTEYIHVDADLKLSEKVIRTLKNKFSSSIYLSVYRCAMSYEKDKANTIFKFLKDAFKFGENIYSNLAMPSVMRVMEIERNVLNESHHFLGFVRFSQIFNGILFSKISPKNNVIPLIAPHFTDRLSNENWLIYDENRKIAAVYKSSSSWVLIEGQDINIDDFLKNDSSETEIENLWKTFFKTIGIESRENYKLQRNLMPKRFRGNMTEFK